MDEEDDDEEEEKTEKVIWLPSCTCVIMAGYIFPTRIEHGPVG